VAQVSVGKAALVVDAFTRVAEIATPQAEPSEVTLQVRFDGRQYTFQLLSEDYLFEPVPARSLMARPDASVEGAVAQCQTV
jgi:hypothetical protein